MIIVFECLSDDRCGIHGFQKIATVTVTTGEFGPGRGNSRDSGCFCANWKQSPGWAGFLLESVRGYWGAGPCGSCHRHGSRDPTHTRTTHNERAGRTEQSQILFRPPWRVCVGVCMCGPPITRSSFLLLAGGQPCEHSWLPNAAADTGSDQPSAPANVFCK